MANSEASSVSLLKSGQFTLHDLKGEPYLIQVSCPLHWKDGQPSQSQASVPFIYFLDGNAIFATATETAWRLSASEHFSGGGIAVAIGYPRTPETQHQLFDARRGYDYTPPTSSSTGASTSNPQQGGADDFLTFLLDTIKPAVQARFPSATCSREALYGHSFGGLFALHVLFNRPRAFDFYIASSPSIWWHDRYILREADAYLERWPKLLAKSPAPSLLLSYGTQEQDPPRRPSESDDQFAARTKMWDDFRIIGNVRDLAAGGLAGCEGVAELEVVVFEGEDHVGATTSSANRALRVFFEEWPLRHRHKAQLS